MCDVSLVMLAYLHLDSSRRSTAP